jgi:hypothetical protein
MTSDLIAAAGFEHGKLSTYVNGRCRCAECKAARSAYDQARRQARRVARGLPAVAEPTAPAHGTYARYKSRRFPCRCDLCMEANREAYRTVQVRLAERRLVDPAAVPHGTTGGYRNWGCKCEACSAAHREARDGYKRRARRPA